MAGLFDGVDEQRTDEIVPSLSGIVLLSFGALAGERLDAVDHAADLARFDFVGELGAVMSAIPPGQPAAAIGLCG